MIYCVDIREQKSGNTVKTVLETKDYFEAYKLVNEYNKEYGQGSKHLVEFPKSKYFIDVYNDETR